MLLNMETDNVFPSFWVDSHSQSCVGKCCVHINTMQIKSYVIGETMTESCHWFFEVLLLETEDLWRFCFCYISIFGHQKLSAPSSNFSSLTFGILEFTRASMNAFTNILNRRCPTSFMKQYHTNTQESLRAPAAPFTAILLYVRILLNRHVILHYTIWFWYATTKHNWYF